MQIQENILLAPYTTFKIGGPARWFCVVRDQFDALQAYDFAKEKNLQTFVLGGGSNVLINDKGYNGLVIKVENSGIEVITPTLPSQPRSASDEWRDPSTRPQRHSGSLGMEDDKVLLKVASGEVWDKVVDFAVKNKWWGIENLSHIPGSTGAIAVQNVGAYGQEASKVIESVTVFDKETHQILNFKTADCEFEYRKSIFNSSQKGKYIIFNIVFRLEKNGTANLSYRDLAFTFKNQTPDLEDVRKAVIDIRNKKFPFPTEAKKGNAGSFFKNPVLGEDSYQSLKNIIETNFDTERAGELENKKFSENGQIKVPAAFLIDLCALKNQEMGGAAINQNQPLVIINKSGEATASDVLSLANLVKELVFKKTGITLQFEPELIGF